MAQAAFGPELRRRREAAGLSLTDLARLIHYDKGHLSRIERGGRPPTPELARRSDDALDAGGALSALVPVRAYAPEGSGDAAGGASGEPHAYGSLAPNATMIAANADVQRAFRSIMAELRRLGQQIAPALVINHVATQVQTLKQLAEPGDPAGARILLLAARCAEYAGWMAQESGDLTLARRWTAEAIQMSTAAGDLDIPAYALVRYAEIALYLRDALRVIDLATRAQAAPGTSDRIRALAAHREAQGHALAGDRYACERALDRAEGLLPNAGSNTGRPEELVIGSSTVRDLGAAVSGWCYHDLGRSRRAAELLEPVVRDIPAWARRARGRFGARLALAHLSAGDLDQACTAGRDVLDLLRHTGSATTFDEMRELSRALVRWRRHPAARELHLDLTIALHDAPTAR
ncbi:helix-turn-helix transcriptional regulator [Microbispora bryophytorum]|uniref:helix-turn-helix transcriptional regulator n=1 Tax=Microbispora bryophytorum TaxID=1460882 RepID=UPI0033EDA0CE